MENNEVPDITPDDYEMDTIMDNNETVFNYTEGELGYYDDYYAYYGLDGHVTPEDVIADSINKNLPPVLLICGTFGNVIVAIVMYKLSRSRKVPES